ncbi:beta strand repeat-containing protein [Qipengyuania oceanensis]|uniref:Autotransporter domain-containing protein n=1 Tax=Qipengyuania oceanensis TaxID=1463597 RepID=A0A844YJE1_9SPHN|nr:hypothetical protein [Qipengyuania oceanensis]MXO64077.1 hypothetical protein [Qipengyuania oceanensis]
MIKTSRNLRRAALLLQAGTAMPLLMATAVHATPIIVFDDGDIVVDEASASGDPTAVDVYSSGGSVDISVDTVTATAPDDARADVVYVGAGGSGTVTANFGSITATGGNLRAALIETESGAIDVTVGSVTMDGEANAGVHALSASGDVTINAQDVRVLGTGIDPNYEVFPEAVFAQSGEGSATVIVGHAETFGLFGSAVIALAGTDATIQVDSATAHSDGAVAVSARGGDSTTITAGTVTMTGDGNAIEGASDGSVTISADTVSSGGLGILAQGGESIAVTSGTLDAARGILADGGTTAETSVSVEGAVTTTNGYGVVALGETVTVIMSADSSITAEGSGVTANGQTAATVVAQDIASVGQAIRATTLAAGPVNVTVNGTVESSGSNAVSLVGNGVILAITEGAEVISHAGNASVAIGGRDGNISIANAGTIAAYDAAASGIGVSTSGNIAIDSNTVVVSTDQAPNSPFTASAINAESTGGSVDIAAQSVTVDAPGRYGINSVASGDGDVSITAGVVSMTGATLKGIRGDAQTGDVTIAADTVSTTADGAMGAYGHSVDGNVSVSVDLVSTEGGIDFNTGEAAEGAFAQSDNGFASVAVNEATIGGYASSGAIAIGGAGATLTAGNLTVAGQYSAAAYAQSNNGDASANVGSVTLTGDRQGAVNVIADGGNAMLSIGQINSEGTLANGAYAYALNNATINSGSVAVQNYGIVAIADNGAATVSTTGDTTADLRWSIRGIGADVNITTAADTLTQGGTDGIWAQAADTATVVNGGTALATGDLGSAIRVTGNGALSVTSDTAVVTGAGADPGVRPNDTYRIEQGGIIVEGAEGPIMIDSGTVDVAGEYRYGISARGNGPISITANTVTLASADSVAVVGRGGVGDVSITTGSVTTTGASGVGVFGNATSGNVTIDAGTTRVENEGLQGDFTGDAVVGSSDSGSVTITSDNAYSAAYGGSAVVGIGANVSIDSIMAETAGDGGIAVYGAAQMAGGSVSINADTIVASGTGQRALYASSNGGNVDVTVGDVTSNVESNTAYGLFARGASTSIDVNGELVSGGMAVNSQSFGGTSVVNVNGSVVSALDIGVSTFAQYGEVNVADGASIEAARAAVVFTNLSPVDAGIMYLDNHGTISGSVGVYVNPNGQGISPSVYIYNDGTITGTTTGFAVITGNADDSLELTENAIVNGIVDLGGGDADILSVGFTDGAAADAIGSVAQTINTEYLSVNDGYWIANTGNSVYQRIAIDQGAGLEIQQVDGYAAVVAPNVVVDGELALNFNTDTEAGDLTGISIEGDGSVHVTGTATILFDDTSGLTYTGGTYVENGTLLLTDEYGYNVYTSGDGTFQLGDGDTAGDFTGSLVNDGTFVFARSDDYTFSGDFSGTGSFEKLGEGRILFDGLYAFDGLTTIYAGSVALSGALAADTQLQVSGGVFDLSSVQGGAQTIASLSGTGGTLILGDISLTVDQTGTTSYFGDITGSGEFIVEGTGDLKLEGDISFTGDAIINGGTLSVNGSMTEADFFVNTGGTLGGNGEVGPVVVDGGTIGAGNSIGTLTVVGDLTLSAASIFEIEVNAAGEADLVNVTGTATLGGATASILAEEGAYAPFTEYTVLTAGSVVGTFGDITTNYAFLTPQFAYDATEVSLVLRRNDIAFSDFGATGNQSAVGGLIEDLAVGSVLYNEALLLTAAEVSPAFETLTGEAYPAYLGAMVETAEMLRDQLRPAPAEGVFAWGNGLLGKVDGSGSGYRDAELSSKGVAGGLGYGNGPLQASIGLGKVWHDADDLGVSDAQTTVLSARVGYGQALGFSGEVGIQKGWSDANIARTTSLGSISENLAGEIDGDYLQVFGEAGYLFGSETAAFGPYVGLSTVNLDADDLTETGGVTALDISDLDRTVTFGRIGGKFDARMAGGLTLGGNAAYRRAWGDRENAASIAFADNGSDVLIGALPIDKSAWELGASIGYRSGRLALEAGYAGTFSDSYDSHGGRLSLSIGF